MDCSRIPSAKFWSQSSVQTGAGVPAPCEVLLRLSRTDPGEAPDQLLAELDGPPMPEEFWIGFWDSLEKKLPAAQETAAPIQRLTKLIRRAAVVAAVVWLAIINQKLPESPSYEINRGVRHVRPVDFLPSSPSSSYPLIEDMQNPAARYYIFQAGHDQKIVMIINPDMEM